MNGGSLQGKPAPARAQVTFGVRTVLAAALAVAVLGALSYLLVGLPLVVLVVVGAWCLRQWFVGHSGALRAMAARPAGDGDASLVQLVHGLADSAGIDMPDVYVSPKECPNAFAVSTRKGSAVCVTESIQALLNERELRGVVAHELSHVKNRDSAFSLFFDAVTRTLTYTLAAIGALIGVALAMGAKRKHDEDAAIAFGLLIAAAGMMAANIIFNAAMRQRERLADKDGATIAGDPLALAAALEKLELGVRGRPVELGFSGASVAALCIVSPLSAGPIARLLDSHPSTASRVRRLRALATGDDHAAFEAAQRRSEWEAEVQQLEGRLTRLRSLRPRPCNEIRGLPFEGKRGEMHLGTFTAELIEQRTRSGRPYFTITDRGRVHVTDKRITLAGDNKRHEWRLDKVWDIGWQSTPEGRRWMKISVSNRQKPSGLVTSRHDLPEAATALEAGYAAAHGELAQLIEQLHQQLRRLRAAQPRAASA